jgi:hypothetical protein
MRTRKNGPLEGISPFLAKIATFSIRIKEHKKSKKKKEHGCAA